MENDLFNPNNISKPRNSLNKNEKLALKEIKSWDDKVVLGQDNDFRFVLLNNGYESKLQHQIDRSSFTALDIDNSNNFEKKVNSWISKWTLKVLIYNYWKRFITLVNSKPWRMDGLVKTHKVNDPVEVITNGCNTATKNLSVL